MLVGAIVAAFTLATAVALEVLLIAGVIVGMLLLFGAGCVIVEEFGDDIKDFAAKIAHPFEKPFIWLWSKVGDYVAGAFSWFFQTSYFVQGFTPFAVLIILALVAWGIIFTNVFLAFWLFILTLVAIIVIGTLLILGIVFLDEWFKGRESYRPGRFKRFVAGSADTVKLGVTYASTKKQGSRICPFIDLQDPEVEPSS